MRRFLFFGLSLSLFACGDEPAKKSQPSENNISTNNTSTNNTSSNNTSSNNTATNNTSNNIDPLLCGNGVLDAGEACDSGIPTGTGSCPNACANESSCAVSRVVGTAAQCTARCVAEPVSTCNDGDGCCPAGCDFSTDNDCSATCGDNVVDENETCDGNCPTSCQSNNACAPASLQGSAASCNATCVTTPIAICRNNDGCCAPGCTSNNDNDCSASCGNQIVEAGETCDGNCPTQCSDNNTCTTDTLVGSPAACTARCQFNPITSCQSGDGCCPTGCTFAQDTDCNCQPLTCQPGQCGSVSNGCGGFLNCGGCGTNQVCSNNQCINQPTLRPAGSACTAASQCAGIIDPFCSTNVNYYQGYCSSECQFDNDCYSGSHCAQKDTNGIGSCLDNCNTNADCRTNYECIPSGAPNNAKACLPSGVGTVPIGGACTALYQCNNGAEAICETSFPGGYCTQTCTDVLGLSGCPTGSACNTDFLSVDGYCAKTCNPGTCRSGYSCQTVTPIFGNPVNLCLPN